MWANTRRYIVNAIWVAIFVEIISIFFSMMIEAKLHSYGKRMTFSRCFCSHSLPHFFFACVLFTNIEALLLCLEIESLPRFVCVCFRRLSMFVLVVNRQSYKDRYIYIYFRGCKPHPLILPRVLENIFVYKPHDFDFLFATNLISIFWNLTYIKHEKITSPILVYKEKYIWCI